MLLNNEFMVDASVDTTWALLTDLERVMPCMPGASLEGREGDDFLGSVKVKVGPITAQFRGTARYLDLDGGAHKATIQASGKDPKGQASANAMISARLEPVTSTSTRVFVDTELDITGRMAQFGRGAIADVSNRLMGQFTENLGREIAGGSGAVGPGPTAAIGTAPEVPTQELNALAMVGPALARRAVPVLIGILVGVLLGRGLSRRAR